MLIKFQFRKVNGVCLLLTTTDENMCNKNPCKNGGTCIDGLNHHRCRCTTGFTGATCQRSK